jgi:hypothetical protein
VRNGTSGQSRSKVSTSSFARSAHQALGERLGSPIPDILDCTSAGPSLAVARRGSGIEAWNDSAPTTCAGARRRLSADCSIP